MTAGIVLYALFMVGAFKIKLFEGLQGWTMISKLTLLSGPVLIALGFYFSTIQSSIYMIVPLVVYFSTSSLGRLVVSLRSKEGP